MRDKTITKEIVKKALKSYKLHPSVPEIVVAIINMTNSPIASIHDLERLIEQDKELSARILQIANSGFYGFNRKITTISHAIVLLGWNTIKTIALGATIMKRVSEQNRHLYSHSVRTAHIARFLADKANFYKVEEIAFVGLLHDLGIIIFEVYFKEIYLKVKQYALDHHIPIHIAEREYMGVDHAVVGGWTLEEWGLPENINDSVGRHHSFDPDTYHARKTAVIHVADVLAFAIDYSGPSWEKVTELAPSSLDSLGFSEAELKKFVLSIMKMKYEPLVI